MLDIPPATKSPIESGTIIISDFRPTYSFVITSQDSKPVVTIHPDGRIELGPDAKPTEAAKEMFKALQPYLTQMMQHCDKDHK